MGQERIAAERAHLNLWFFTRNYRFALWMLLVLLTAIILLFPVHLTLEYHPVQTLYIFDNLLLFGALFYIWLLSLLVLLFSGRSEAKTDWEKVALVCISSLVFLAFWAIILPYGRLDYFNNAALTRTIQQDGTIPVGGTFYADFPGLHLMIVSLSQVTGLRILGAINLFLVINAVTFSALLYVVLTNLLKSTSVAAFAALLVMLGNMFLARGYTFWPGIPSLVLLLAFLVVLSRGQGALLETIPHRVILIILLLAATAMYFQVSVLLPLILVGVFLVQRMSKMAPIAISTICLFAVIPIAWEIYWAVQTLDILGEFASKIAADITQGTFLDWVPFLAQSNVGEKIPLWASGTRILWWALIFGLGTILGLRNLLRVKELSLVERVETGGLLGVIMLAVIATLASPGGERFVHFLHYAAFFTVPILVRFSLDLGSRIKGYGFTALAIVFFVLSFPTFLASNGKISTESFYSYEISVGEFLERSYGSGEGLAIANPAGPERYYLLDADLTAGLRQMAAKVGTDEELWLAVDDLRLEQLDRLSVYVVYAKLAPAVEAARGIPTTDPQWQVIEGRLSMNHLTYDNGQAQIYRPVIFRRI